MTQQRKLAAIMFTDIAGFTALSAEDEEKALALIEKQRDILQPIVKSFSGSWLKETGDGLLLSFSSSRQALDCAISIQATVREIEDLNLRIGIHRGDIFERGGDVFGDDVNIASRIEPFAAAGGIAISDKVQRDISGSPEFTTKYLGRPKLKGVKQEVKVYCLTSHGLVDTRLAEVAAKLEKQPSYWLRYGAPLMVLVAAGLYFFTGGNGAIESIAVLPLENLSNDPEQEYFVDGMMNEMIANLSKIGALRIISRTSVMRYKNTDMPLAQIARELGVDAVVEGSVLRIGEMVRITAQLIRAKQERNLWSQTYDRDLSDILALHSEVARDIANKIKITITPQEETRLAGARPVNPETYETYLKGMFHWFRLTPQDLETALQYFELALEKDPNYTLAYAGIAAVWGARLQFGFVPPREALPKVKSAALRALELDSTLAEAHWVLAVVRTWSDWDWEGGETEFRWAIELNPNYALARLHYSLLLTMMRRLEEAMAQIERALELDPFNPLFQTGYGKHLMFVRRYDDAIVQFRNALRIAPNFGPAQYNLARAFHQKQMYDEALAQSQKEASARGDRGVEEALARGYAERGYRGAMHRAAETLAARSRTTYVAPYLLAKWYARAGENDRALEWLESAYEARDPGMFFLGWPFFDSLRDDPRFQALLRRMNFPE